MSYCKIMKKLLLTVSLLFLTSLLWAQSEVLMGSQAVVTNCSFLIHDDGGTTGDYSPNAHQTLTIYSNDPSNASVMVEVQTLDIDPSDTLIFYDGIDTNATVLHKINNSNYDPTGTFRYAATIQNTTGAVTIYFKSDASAGGGGFTVFASCMAPCQRIFLELDSALCSKLPQIDTDGYYYLNVCPYDTIHLAIKGIYPDNNYSYNQNDATTTFHWDFGLETLDSTGGNQVDYYFIPGRGYDFSVTAEDQSQCVSLIPVAFRVRTSQNPIDHVVPPYPFCSGDEMILSYGYDQVSNVQLTPVGSEQITSLGVTDTVFLPDGVSCPPYGYYYRSYVNFTSFAPNATITNANDILYVRIKMEHSAIEDIRITFVCPTGNVCRIVPDYQNDGWGGITHYFRTNLGVANRQQEVATCNASQNPMGIPWNYVWSNNTTLGYQYANTTYGYCYEPGNVHYTANPYWDDGNMSYKIDPTDVANMTQVYHPNQSFAGMVGCPLNGAWYIQVQDLWTNDNGYIVEWEMALDPSLLPQNWSYEVHVDTTYVIGPGANGSGVNPDTSGSIMYTYRVIDEYGCVYDTLVPLQIYPSPNPNVGPDISICHGDLVQLEPSMNVADTSTVYHWNTGDVTETISVLTNGDYSVTVTSTFYDTTGVLTCLGYDSIHVDVYESPSIDYDNTIVEGCAPLTIHVTNHSTPTNADYQWMVLDANYNAILTSHQYNPTFEIEDPGHYNLYLKVTTQDGCVDSIIRWDYIRVNAQPIAEFVATPEISLMSETQGQVVFTNYADQNILNAPGSSFYWDFDDGETDSATISPTHVFAQWGDYDVVLHIETEDGCASEIAHTVVVEQDLVFPNVITPNGDGINDVFAIENLNTNINLEDPDEYRTNKLYIYDRWGKKVYSAKNYDTYSRDGQIVVGEQFFDGANLSDGVYYYSFYFKGKAKTVNYNGSLTILR